MAWTIEAKWLAIFVCLILYCSPSLASPEHEPWDRKIYPDLQEMVESCKQALVIAEIDMEAFMRTYCAANISGIVLAFAYLKMPRVTVTGAKSYVESHPELRNICLEQAENDQYPPEFRVAQRFVKNAEKMRKSNEGDFSEYGGLYIIGTFINQYQCKSKKEGKEHGMDD